MSATGIDWFRVVVDLERSGLSQAEIGKRVGRSQVQINAYKTIPGTEPRHSVGQALIALWAERCVDSRAKVLASAPVLR